MLKKNIFIAVLLVGSMFLFTGCNGNDIASVTNPFFGGTRGLVCNFENLGYTSDTSSTNEIWSTQRFPLTIECWNKGEFDLSSGTIKYSIKGISSDYFSGLQFTKTNPGEIEGRSDYMPDGGSEIIDFGNGQITYMAGNYYTANIYVYYEYPYKTQINVPQICIKGDHRDDSVCTVDSSKTVFFSGGPLAVETSARERYVSKNKIQVEIKVRNAQDGKTKALSGDDYDARFDEFEFEVDNPRWTCTSETGSSSIARITYSDGNRGTSDGTTIRCVRESIADDDLFTESFSLILNYYYKDSTAAVVNFKKSLD